MRANLAQDTVRNLQDDISANGGRKLRGKYPVTLSGLQNLAGGRLLCATLVVLPRTPAQAGIYRGIQGANHAFQTGPFVLEALDSHIRRLLSMLFAHYRAKRAPSVADRNTLR